MTATSEKILIDGEFVPIVSDTNVYKEGEGYERLLMVHFENNTLVKAHVRVDRAPEKSFATGEIWIPTTGWNRIVTLNANEWWRRMPGYLRWSNDRSEVETYHMMAEILTEMLKVPIG